ncbi:MAG: O-antigen ligase family protein [Chloroflexi bacterium]|nr:O-antigen ligase family protein [Chloroflexota bacterium]
MKIRIIVFAEALFLTLVFLLANIRSTIFWSLYPPTDTIFQSAWRETLLWLVALALMVFLLNRRDLYKNYWRAVRQNPFLIVFVVYSVASVFWSNSWSVTFHRSLTFLFATMAAVYLGTRYTLSEIMVVLANLGVVVFLTSFLLIFLMPVLGTDLNPPYNGAWRGIFWHKNQLGNIVPIFTIVFLFRLFAPSATISRWGKSAAFVLYLLSLVMIFFAKSASGHILEIIIHLVLGVVFLWRKLRYYLTPRHYYLLVVLFIAGGVVLLLKLDFILALFGRTPTFTGRVPLWTILLRSVVLQKPLGGYGFGTIWADEQFRNLMRERVGWPYQVMIGDNGFLDILLNLGFTGLVLFLLNYGKAWINSVKFFLQRDDLEGFFPFVFLVYSLFANVTFSLFMETEVFVWMLIVSLMVIATRGKRQSLA